MLVDEKIKIKINSRHVKFYLSLGYNIQLNDIIYVPINHISKQSHIEVKCICDFCHTEKIMKMCDYNKITNDQTTPYYCKDCKSIKTKETLNNLYGVDNTFQREDIKKKIVQTNNEKYGVDYPQQSKEIRKKSIKTNNEKYGVDYVQQNAKVRKKKEETNLERYGNKTSLLNKDVQDKGKKKLIEIYGVDNVMKSEKMRKIALQTRKNNILEKYKYLNIKSVIGTEYTLYCDNNLDHDYTIPSNILYLRLRCKTILCTICNPLNSSNTSGKQQQLIDFITNNYNGEININNKTIINPYEIDVYLPEKRLGIEFNGTYWHSVNFKGDKYHYDKTVLSEKNGIQLLHIYEDDWTNKRDIVESMIKNRLNLNQIRISARKCKIMEVDSKISKIFINENHIQGNINSSIKIGLYYKDELVSIMTLSKLRRSLGSKSITNSYEMLRYCSKLGINVMGGASRMFSYFIRNYSHDVVISYADRSWSQGNLYKRLGFEFISETRPNYYYVINYIRCHRFNYRKDKLVSMGHDPNKTEFQIMEELGYPRIYDSGHLKFIYETKKPT